MYGDIDVCWQSDETGLLANNEKVTKEFSRCKVTMQHKSALDAQWQSEQGAL